MFVQHYPVKMLERSIHSARYVFVENLYRSSVLELFARCIYVDFVASLYLHCANMLTLASPAVGHMLPQLPTI